MLGNSQATRRNIFKGNSEFHLIASFNQQNFNEFKNKNKNSTSTDMEYKNQHNWS